MIFLGLSGLELVIKPDSTDIFCQHPQSDFMKKKLFLFWLQAPFRVLNISMSNLGIIPFQDNAHQRKIFFATVILHVLVYDIQTKSLICPSEKVLGIDLNNNKKRADS